MQNEFKVLAEEHPGRWPIITKCESASRTHIAHLAKQLEPILRAQSQTTVLAFGSLARLEMTAGSDLDWAIVHDGPASSDIRALQLAITKKLKDLGVKLPGEQSEFGQLNCGFQIVDNIASRKDERSSLSRRMLLLLESVPLGNARVRDSLVKEVLASYRNEETLSNESKYYIPRYLLNDINQFWRLMCTDYAGQTRAKAGTHWGLRSVKLSFSRKLLFVSGLLKCFHCHVCEPGMGSGPKSSLPDIYARFNDLVNIRPIDIAAHYFHNQPEIFDHYEFFLQTLETKRDELGALTYEEVDNNRGVLDLWSRSREYNDLIVEGMLSHDKLGPLVRSCLIL